jgi:hypothetical protein
MELGKKILREVVARGMDIAWRAWTWRDKKPGRENGENVPWSTQKAQCFQSLLDQYLNLCSAVEQMGEGNPIQSDQDYRDEQREEIEQLAVSMIARLAQARVLCEDGPLGEQLERTREHLRRAVSQSQAMEKPMEQTFGPDDLDALGDTLRAVRMRWERADVTEPQLSLGRGEPR